MRIFKNINLKKINLIRGRGNSKGVMALEPSNIGFLVSSFLIIIVGIVSYSRAKSTIIMNYEETTLGNMENSSLYFNLLMKDIEAKSSQIANNNDLIYYYTYLESTVK